MSVENVAYTHTHIHKWNIQPKKEENFIFATTQWNKPDAGRKIFMITRLCRILKEREKVRYTETENETGYIPTLFSHFCSGSE
jgi:hypothetical protein